MISKRYNELLHLQTQPIYSLFGKKRVGCNRKNIFLILAEMEEAAIY